MLNPSTNKGGLPPDRHGKVELLKKRAAGGDQRAQKALTDYQKRQGTSGGGFLEDRPRREPIPFTVPRERWQKLAEAEGRRSLAEVGDDPEYLPLHVESAMRDMEDAARGGLQPPYGEPFLYAALGLDKQTGQPVATAGATATKSAPAAPPPDLNASVAWAELMKRELGNACGSLLELVEAHQAGRAGAFERQAEPEPELDFFARLREERRAEVAEKQRHIPPWAYGA